MLPATRLGVVTHALVVRTQHLVVLLWFTVLVGRHTGGPQMSRSKFEGDTAADCNQSGEPLSPELEGFEPFSVPLAAVIAKLRGKTLVKVRAGSREKDTSPR